MLKQYRKASIDLHFLPDLTSEFESFLQKTTGISIGQRTKRTFPNQNKIEIRNLSEEKIDKVEIESQKMQQQFAEMQLKQERESEQLVEEEQYSSKIKNKNCNIYKKICKNWKRRRNIDKRKRRESNAENILENTKELGKTRKRDMFDLQNVRKFGPIVEKGNVGKSTNMITQKNLIKNQKNIGEKTDYCMNKSATMVSKDLEMYKQNCNIKLKEQNSQIYDADFNNFVQLQKNQYSYVFPTIPLRDSKSLDFTLNNQQQYTNNNTDFSIIQTQGENNIQNQNLQDNLPCNFNSFQNTKLTNSKRQFLDFAYENKNNRYDRNINCAFYDEKQENKNEQQKKLDQFYYQTDNNNFTNIQHNQDDNKKNQCVICNVNYNRYSENNKLKSIKKCNCYCDNYYIDDDNDSKNILLIQDKQYAKMCEKNKTEHSICNQNDICNYQKKQNYAQYQYQNNCNIQNDNINMENIDISTSCKQTTRKIDYVFSTPARTQVMEETKTEQK